MSELFYFLFARKNCPRCNCIMERRKEFESVPGSMFKSHHHSVFRPNAIIKHYIYLYSCPACGAEYTLQELAKKR